MAGRIEDYAIIGNTQTVALVDRSGSVDWWCVPRIDSGAAFAALLGTEANGRWLLAPQGEITAVTRRYEPDTLVLETLFQTPTGTVALIDFMPPEHDNSVIHRIVEGRDGSVEMTMELIVRFDYGSITPWVRTTGEGLIMVAGQDGLRFHSPVPLQGTDHTTVASFEVRAGDKQSFSLTYFASDARAPLPLNSMAALVHTRRWWLRLGKPVHLPRRAARRGGPLADHPESADLRADRRDRRGRHHLAAREARRRAQLGLPLLLAPRRHVHPAGVCSIAGYVDEARLAGVAAPRRGGQPRGPPDHVRRGRRAPADRDSSSTGCRATRGRSRCGSATPRRASSSSTSSAR